MIPFAEPLLGSLAPGWAKGENARHPGVALGQLGQVGNVADQHQGLWLGGHP